MWDFSIIPAAKEFQCMKFQLEEACIPSKQKIDSLHLLWTSVNICNISYPRSSAAGRGGEIFVCQLQRTWDSVLTFPFLGKSWKPQVIPAKLCTAESSCWDESLFCWNISCGSVHWSWASGSWQILVRGLGRRRVWILRAGLWTNINSRQGAQAGLDEASVEVQPFGWL